MKPLKRTLPMLVAVIAVASCGGNNRQSTLGDLEYKPKQEQEIEFEKLDHAQVREEYKELLDLFEDKQLKEQIERRIADVYMMESVHTQHQDVEKKSYYLEAIKEYEKILEKYPNSPDNAEVLYQLAKAYDMEGEQEKALRMLTELTSKHPYYPNLAEAWFRVADIHFSNQRYDQAKHAYQQVTQLNTGTLWVNAHYMLGWTHYKQFQYEKSLDSYANVLNTYLAGKESAEGLGKAEKPVVEDTLHSISLSLDKLAGAETIPNVPGLVGRSYVWMLYKKLGDFYLEKELFGEAVNSYRAYIDANPSSQRAPVFHNMVINAHIKGGFPALALEEKALYVKAYGIHSSFNVADEAIRASISTSLREYLEELAKFHHSAAQDYDKKLAELEEKPKGQDKRISVARKDAKASYDSAAAYYKELADTFPNDPNFDSTMYYRAEVLFAGKRYAEAVHDYEFVAYTPKGKSAEEQRPDAGYAAIISYQKHIDTYPEAEQNSKAVRQWQEKAVASMLNFAGTFHADERSPSVLTNAAEYLFSLNKYEQAIEVSTALLNKNPNLDNNLKKTAYGIAAHSWFKLENYVEAEASYLNQRALVAQESEEYKVISERLATTIYKNSETIVQTGDKQATIAELLKIKALSPNSTRRVPAQYDAVILLMELKQWDTAIDELLDLKANFSEHELAVEFPRKLALAYERDERWQAASQEYLALNANDPDLEVQREALFAAAMMFEKSAEHEKAIKYFKQYAHRYEQPFDTRMEARYRLALNYETLGEAGKMQYWLRRVIEANRKAGDNKTERSIWLAAWANTKYGDFYAEQFHNTKLTQPLVKSLPKRNGFLEQASASYQQAAESGVLEYVTLSGYKIAKLYQALASDLRTAPPPSNLSGSDIQLYESIIEEQAQPLDQLAIELHEANASRAWDGEFNEWIDKSFVQLRALYPERYAKSEVLVSYGDEIR